MSISDKEILGWGEVTEEMPSEATHDAREVFSICSAHREPVEDCALCNVSCCSWQEKG